MSIEFTAGGAPMNLGQLLDQMLREQTPQPNWEPDPDRYVSVLDLLKDHQRRLDEAAEYTETAMLTPRITVREHEDIHLLTTALNKYMTDATDEWYNAVAAHGVGNNSETMERLTLRSREITEATKLVHALQRVHSDWAKANENTPDVAGVSEEHTEEFPDSYEN